MSEDANATTEEIEAEQAMQGLAYVCMHVEEISASLTDDDEGGLEALEQLRSALSSNGNISGPLDDIHHALLRAGDVLGVYGHVRGLQDLVLAGFETGPLEVVYRCPVHRCPRTVPGPAVTPPSCGMTGETLCWGRL